MEGNAEVALGGALTALNLLAMMIGWRGLGLASAVMLFIVAAAGYVSARSRDLALTLSELVSLSIIITINYSWVSPRFALQELGTIAALFIIGWVFGASLSWGGLSKPTLPKPRRSVIQTSMGGVGLVLIGYALWGLTSNYSGLPPYPHIFLSPTFLASSIAAVLLTAYSATARGTPYSKASVLSAVTGFLGPTAFPVAVSLLPKGGEEIADEGGLLIGRVRKVLKGRLRPGSPLFITFELGSTNHVVVLGASGTGKTTVVKQMVKEAVREGLNVVIIDFHGEYDNNACDRIDAVNERLNPLALMGRAPHTAAEELSDAVARAFRLGSLQKMGLNRLLLKAYEAFKEDVNPELLLDIINDPETPEALGVSPEVVKSLRPYVESLSGHGVRWLNPEELLIRCKSLDLSRIENAFLQDLMAESVIRSIHYLRRASPGVTLLIVEEAHRVLGGRGREAYAHALREGRKFGVSIITVLQDPYYAGSYVMNNSPRTIALRLMDEANISYVTRNLATATGESPGKIRKALGGLKGGEALVRLGSEIYVVKVGGSS